MAGSDNISDPAIIIKNVRKFNLIFIRAIQITLKNNLTMNC